MHCSYLLYDVEDLLLQTDAAEKAGNIKPVTDKQKRKPSVLICGYLKYCNCTG